MFMLKIWKNTEQTKIRGKPSHNSWLELTILVLTEPSLFQSWGSLQSAKFGKEHMLILHFWSNKYNCYMGNFLSGLIHLTL